MEKEPCGVLVSFYEVMKLRSFEFDIYDVIPANIQNFSPWFSLHIFVNFMEREPSTRFNGVFEHFLRTDGIAKF